LIITFCEPLVMESGGPVQVQVLPTVAAGMDSMNTSGFPPGSMGPPTCGLPLPGFTMGQVWLSPTLAAGLLMFFF
jgi:hypothetical protein